MPGNHPIQLLLGLFSVAIDLRHATIVSESQDMPINEHLHLNELEYLSMNGLDVMLAHDYYPEGHQGGVGIIQNGHRIATNGDLRLEPAPGQWSPIPKVGDRQVDRDANEISLRLSYPDESRDKKGFNPIDYPDLQFAYRLTIRPEGKAFRIIVDLDEPLPDEWYDKVGFNLELYPGIYFGKSFQLGDSCGIFPRQPSGTSRLPEVTPMATGRKLSVAPESHELRLNIEQVHGGDLQLIDGRCAHNNGWFVVRATLAPGVRTRALEWLVTGSPIANWRHEPVLQVSQVGYHPEQSKVAVIELDTNESEKLEPRLLKVNSTGDWIIVKVGPASDWGKFLRYNYLQFDFSEIKAPGIYAIQYGEKLSSVFRISPDVFTDGVWQPTVEYFLPVQMCHMRVNENYRVWHGLCHMDDATMAPVDHNHFDGYVQGNSTLCNVASGTELPNLAVGGWHDAGDYDLRVESQSDTVHGLALAYEEFQLDFDNTTINQTTLTAELLLPDGKPDILQQIEHGCLSIVAGYRTLGRLYRGIIEQHIRQYTHLGDAATVTDNVRGSGDDRWVFTEQNNSHELGAVRALASASRVLSGFNESLSSECLVIAKEVFGRTQSEYSGERVEAALELWITTGDAAYRAIVTSSYDLCQDIQADIWIFARAVPYVDDLAFMSSVLEQVTIHQSEIGKQVNATPYGVPYVPNIWGAGWGLQRFGVKQYWLWKSFPDSSPITPMLQALNFILGCHPGRNTASFVSGVGSKSMIPGYGVNRADESFIPGGIGSGTALIRPDFPELLEWPYLWQQTEYCMGYATSDYIFLVAAADKVLNGL